MVPSTTPSQSRPKRRLVTVRHITKVTPIRGSRRNIITIDGWNVAVGRNAGLLQGQLVVYFEVDSFLPNNSAFWEYCTAWPTKFHDGSIGFLVQTTMIDRHLSQGLVFNIDDFPVITTTFNNLRSKYNQDENAAVRELLTMSFEEVLGDFQATPHFLPQPGCDRAQNIPALFETHGDDTFHITEKLDGFPMSVYIVQRSSQWYTGLPRLPDTHAQCIGPARVGVCSLLEDIPAGEDSTSHSSPWFWKAAEQQRILHKISRLGNDIAVQGELCGSSIMGNSMGFAEGEHRFYVFGIYDIGRQRYLPPRLTVCACKDLGWDHVPVVSVRSRLRDFAKDVGELLHKAEGVGVRGRKREGYVFKSIYTGFCFKAISNAWLLEVGKS